MITRDNSELDYDKPIEIAEGVYWVGFPDKDFALHCNPYLIIEGEEAIIIDGGSRTDFSTVMMKILQTGLDPSNIKKLIYQHYDPDLCGSIPDFEEIIPYRKLSILSHRENNVFIKYYGGNLKRYCIETLKFEWKFSTGRKLEFIRTPYAHSPGSFITYDHKTGTLFSSDIFGSYSNRWELFLELSPKCHDCVSYNNCPLNLKECPIDGIVKFHKKIMTSKKALDFALKEIKDLSIKMVAPQHGSIITNPETLNLIIDKLGAVDNIGIDSLR